MARKLCLLISLLYTLCSQSVFSQGMQPMLAEGLLVLDFELNDLTVQVEGREETGRVQRLRPLLEQALTDKSQVVKQLDDAHRHAYAKGQGYVFDRPSVAARMGDEAAARWVVTGRLHKASHLFVYLKSQLIDVETGRVAADFVVEIKGWSPKLTQKGVDSLAVQIDQAIKALEQ